MASDFFSSTNPTDAVYINIRDLKKYGDVREFVERLWAIYYRYGDRHFLSEIGHTFDQRFWEMYLGCVLIDNGIEIQRREEGPDFLLKTNDLQIWIEAVTPTAGDGRDMVDEIPEMDAALVPEDNIVLRFRSAIEDKYTQLLSFAAKGIIGSDDICIIALNGRGIPLAFLSNDDEIPNIIKSVLPFGNLRYEFDISTKKIIRAYYAHRSVISKQSGSEVSTDVFLDDHYAGISAILYSDANAANHPATIGSEFILIHNPTAKNPLRRGHFKFGIEFWYL